MLRTLSDEGRKEIGHIFGSGHIPLKCYTPSIANLRGENYWVFLVDWEALTPEQQDMVIEYMTTKFDDGIPDVIRRYIANVGHFAIRSQYIGGDA